MSFLIYLLQANLYALMMWGLYWIVWRNKPLLTASRIYLLCSLVVPLLLPLVRLSFQSSAVVVMHSVILPEISFNGGKTHSEGSTPWLTIIGWAYTAVALGVACGYTNAYLNVLSHLRKGRHIDGQYTIITATGIGPGSIGRCIFFPDETIHATILKHEMAHITLGHRFDLILLQAIRILFWISPAHWLIGRELKIVHEFEADSLAIKGSDPVDYASLLLSQTLGSPHNLSIAHSFFYHPLKRRIQMLQSSRSPKLTLAYSLTVATLSILVAASVFTQCAKPHDDKASLEMKEHKSGINNQIDSIDYKLHH